MDFNNFEDGNMGAGGFDAFGAGHSDVFGETEEVNK